MLKHYPTLKKLVLRKRKIDGRRLKSKAFRQEFERLILKDANSIQRNLKVKV